MEYSNIMERKRNDIICILSCVILYWSWVLICHIQVIWRYWLYSRRL